MPRRPTARKPPNKRDPKARHFDGARMWSEIVNADPSRRYLWVNKNASVQGVPYWEAIGYRVELAHEDGPSPKCGKTIGDSGAVEMQGHLLMSCDRKEHEQRQRVGIYGDGGWEDADRIEERLIDKRVPDDLRGVRRRYLSVENETTAATEG